MRFCSLFCTPEPPKTPSPPLHSFDDPDPFGLITTEQILYMAADENYMTACEYDIFVKNSHKFPANWTKHHPNLWLNKLPSATCTHLDVAECIRFYISLMHLHIAYDAEMYKPPDGDGFSAMIKSIAYR